MAGLTVDIVGLNDVLSKLKAVGTAKKTKVSNEIKATAYDIVAEAQTRAPVDLNALRGSIRVNSVTELGAEVGVGAYYAAYVEFGTGNYAAQYLASQPEEIQAYARTFFVNGKGHMHAAPFFYPAVYKHYGLLVKRLINELNR